MRLIIRFVFGSVVLYALLVMVALYLLGCARVHPPMVCQAAQSNLGAQVLVCIPVDPGQVRQGPGDV